MSDRELRKALRQIYSNPGEIPDEERDALAAAIVPYVYVVHREDSVRDPPTDRRKTIHKIVGVVTKIEHIEPRFARPQDGYGRATEGSSPHPAPDKESSWWWSAGSTLDGLYDLTSIVWYEKITLNSEIELDQESFPLTTYMYTKNPTPAQLAFNAKLVALLNTE